MAFMLRGLTTKIISKMHKNGHSSYRRSSTNGISVHYTDTQGSHQASTFHPRAPTSSPRTRLVTNGIQRVRPKVAVKATCTQLQYSRVAGGLNCRAQILISASNFAHCFQFLRKIVALSTRVSITRELYHSELFIYTVALPDEVTMQSMDGFSIMKPAKNTLVLQVWLLCRVIFIYSATLWHNFSYQWVRREPGIHCFRMRLNFQKSWEIVNYSVISIQPGGYNVHSLLHRPHIMLQY